MRPSTGKQIMPNWTDFIKTPAKAAKRLHVSQRDVALGAALDEQRVRELLRRQMQGETSAPHTAALSPQEIAALRLYEQRRRAEPPRAQGALGILQQQLPRFFQENQTLADATGDLSLKEGVLGTTGAVLGTALPVAIGSGLTGAATGAGMSIAGDALIDEAARKILGESIQDPLSSGTFGALAGGTGKIIKPLIAALGASSSEAAGMPFHSWMKRLNALNKVEPTAMYVNPTNAELLSMMRDARETYPTSPTVRLLRDRKSHDVYGVEGSSILHDDMRKHLKLKYEFSPGSQGSTLPELDTELHFLKSLPRLAGGGAVKRLGKAAMSAFDELRPSSVAPQGALSVVKNKGGNWLTGSVEDALSGLKGQPFTELDLIAAQQGQLGPIASARVLRDSALNSWIDSQLTKYVKNRMASPEDEVRRLAEQGVLHFEPAMIRERSPLMEKVVGRREAAGFPIQGIADAPLARNWENTSDSIIRNLEALDLSATERAATFGGKTVPKETIVHELNPFASGAGISDLGFNHLIDELSNALNPESGLPRNLQLSPEAMKQLSMEKAVRRVADINAWRAAQKVEANRKLAEQTSIVRAYEPSEQLPNPKGLRWVELKKGEDTGRLQELIRDDPRFQIPEEQQIRFMEQARMEAARKGIEDESDDLMEYVEGRTRELSEDWARKNPAFEDEAAKALRDQLRYEGDTMGHCVGGYCDGVLSGRSRIFSLRDAKGEPHVTVEVGETLAAPGSANYGSGIELPPRITQIKGKQDRAPNPEYLPFVQDFVRNSPLGGAWGDVGDLQNTGLRRARDVWNDLEMAKIKEAGHAPGDYVSHEDKERIGRAVWGDLWGKYASGGPVTKQPNPADNFQGIIAAIEEALA